MFCVSINTKQNKSKMAMTLPTPPALVRTLSTQHVFLALAQMIGEQKCVLEAGYHKNTVGDGWTRWYVQRPDTACLDTNQMKLITMTKGSDGKNLVFVDQVQISDLS